MPNPVRSRSTKLNAAARKASRPREPLWEGPAGAGPNGGVTQSMLGRYLSDGERFRVQFVEGWNPPDRFEPRREFGNMWHACEEAFAKTNDVRAVEAALDAHFQRLAKRYPTDRDEAGEWVAKVYQLFPRCIRHWQENDPDAKRRRPLLQEQTFDVPYNLPSGRSVRLRGKWDGVSLVGDGVWLDECKTKSSIQSALLERQLSFDLQTMTYLVALRHEYDRMGWAARGSLRGVRYNVIRRSAHKTVESMLKKLDEDAASGRIGEWFARWTVEVSAADVARFRRECLDPVLENLFDDWEWWELYSRRPLVDPFDYGRRHKLFPQHRRRHFRFPYGVYAPLTEGGSGEVDEYLSSGSTAGLRRLDRLFEELT